METPQHNENQTATVQSWKPQGWFEWCLLIVMQLGWITMICATSSSLESFLTLPSGVFYLYVQALVILFGVIGWMRNDKYVWPFMLFSAGALFWDWGWHPFGSTIKDNDISVMTWNIQGSYSLENDRTCATKFLQQWTDSAQTPVFLFQEVRQSHRKTIERAINGHCEWNSYFSSSKEGLLICAHKDWTFKYKNHRSMDTGSSYGFQQLEVSNKKNKQTFNVLNVHLPSLYLTMRRSKGTFVTKTNEMSLSDFVKANLRKNPSPIPYLRLLNNQVTAHQSSIQSVVDLVSKLNDPTLVGGDFNMPSTAPVHDSLLNIDMRDAHIEAGWGWDFTKFGLGRIDYLYANKNTEWVGSTIVHSDVTCSDHAPVSAVLSLP